MLPLEGIKVLEVGRVGPVAFAGMILGDMGASVLKVEEPGNLGMVGGGRSPRDEREAHLSFVNRNKRSIVLNLKREEGREIFLKLAREYDVVLEGFRPGVARRLGIDYETLRKVNPKIIYCSLSGYGQDGPYRELPGHDLNYISFAGIAYLIGERGGKPVIPLNLIADYAGASLHAVIGVLLAIIAREKIGEGQFIDISYTRGALALLQASPIFHYFMATKKLPRRGETLLGGGYPYYGIYRTKDDKFISIGCIEHHLWENFLKAIGREDFLRLKFSPKHFVEPAGEEWEEVRKELERIFMEKTRDEWFEFLKDKNVPVGKVYTLDEISNEPCLSDMFMDTEHPRLGRIKYPGIAIKLSKTPGRFRKPPPRLGEDTESILKELGYADDEIRSLFEKGAVEGLNP